MEKRVVLAVVLTIGVIFLSNLLFPTPEPPPGQMVADSALAGDRALPADLDTGRAEVRPDREPALPDSLTGATPDATEGLPDLPEEPADTVTVTTDLLRLQFSTRGAALMSAEVLEYESYTPNGAGEHAAELVRDGDRVFGFRVTVGGDTVRLDGQSFTVDRPELTISESNPRDSLVFRYPFPSGSAEFVVTYGFELDSYLVDVSGRVEGIGDRGYSILTSLGQGLKTNEKSPREDYRQLAYVVRNQRGGIASVNLDKIEPGELQTPEGGPFDWVAVKNKYFVIALVSPEEGPHFGGMLVMGEPAEYTARMVASLPAPAGSGFSFEAYLGPQEYGRLEAVGRSRDLEHVNPYGWRWMRPIIRPLVGIVMVILGWMHNFLGLAYGWVLILFGVLMRVVLFPLYQKSMRSQMAQMQVQPLMKELQAKYKDEPQKLQSEMMKLYKEHNVNPLGGCLPMLLPMPILFALFFVFQSTIEFRGVPFLWLPDLSLKDPYYIIPLVMGASMFLLSWIGQRGMEANAQMKMMTYMMPIVFTVMFANFPSGLNLYYATSNIASLPQQLYLSKERRKARRKADQLKPKSRKDDGGGGSVPPRPERRLTSSRMSSGSTIAAISTPPGRSALAVVRISGPDAFDIAARLSLPETPVRVARYARLRHPATEEPVDDVVAVRFVGPASYTGEDMLEISCHGGPLVPQLVLAAVCEAGARPAEAGEFTRRAFLNGKLDLMQAEATLDLIEARSPAMHRAALFQLERGLSGRIEELREELLHLQGLIAYDIDFPEEDDGPVPAGRIDEAASRLHTALRRMLELAPEGELLRDGALTVIAGRPNVGKSSVFNMLLGFERAIVTEEPGTTRDAIEALVSVNGYPFRLVDTAGLRDGAGHVEGIGIEVARSYLGRADVVLLCVEAGRSPGPDEIAFLAEAGGLNPSRVIVLRTKFDLRADPGGDEMVREKLAEAVTELPVSAHTGHGLPEVRDALLERVYSGIRSDEETPVVTRVRHVECLRRAREDLSAFQEARGAGLPAEIAVTHVQDATLALEDLLGAVTSEDVLDRVFSSFCVGK